MDPFRVRLIVAAKPTEEVCLLGHNDRQIHKGKKRDDDTAGPDGAVDQTHADRNEEVADIHGIARVRVKTSDHQTIRVDLSVLAAPLDVGIPDHCHPEGCPSQRDGDAGRDEKLVQNRVPEEASRPGEKEQEQQGAREQTVPHAEEEMPASEEQSVEPRRVVLRTDRICALGGRGFLVHSTPSERQFISRPTCHRSCTI